MARALNVRYLWIDSLCIVQDDPKDWRRECEMMGLVYRDAHVTIAAADATDSTQGLFSDTIALSYARLIRSREMSRAKAKRARREILGEADHEDEFGEDWEGSVGEGILAVKGAVELPYHGKDHTGHIYISPKSDGGPERK